MRFIIVPVVLSWFVLIIVMPIKRYLNKSFLTLAIELITHDGMIEVDEEFAAGMIHHNCICTTI